ncbi:MAG: hypothetical protein ACXQTD_06160 [Candidatus Syntropharchaeia archaeon]
MENVEAAGGEVVQANADGAYDANWRDKYKYGRRWYAESTFSAVKRKFGEYVRATKIKNMFNEVKLEYLFYNAIIKYDVTHTSFFASLV